MVQKNICLGALSLLMSCRIEAALERPALIADENKKGIDATHQVAEATETRFPTLTNRHQDLSNGSGGERLDKLLPGNLFENAFGSTKPWALKTYIKKHLPKGVYSEEDFLGVKIKGNFRPQPASEQAMNRSITWQAAAPTQKIEYIFKQESILASDMQGALVTVPRSVEAHEEAWLLAQVVGEVRKEVLPPENPHALEEKPGKTKAEPPKDKQARGPHYFTLIASLALLENQSTTTLSESSKAYLLRELETLVERLHPDAPEVTSIKNLLGYHMKQYGALKIPTPKRPLRMLELILARLPKIKASKGLDTKYPETKPYENLIGAYTASEIKSRLETDIRRISVEHHLPQTNVDFSRQDALAENVNTLDATFVKSQNKNARYQARETEEVTALPRKPAIIRYFPNFKILTPSFQLATLFHEARHADCEVPPDQEDLDLLRDFYSYRTPDGYFEQKWRAHRCGFLHTFCHGGIFDKLQRCDPAPWGAYLTSAVFMAANIPPSKSKDGTLEWEYLETMALIEGLQQVIYMPSDQKRPRGGTIDTFMHPILKGKYGPVKEAH